MEVYKFYRYNKSRIIIKQNDTYYYTNNHWINNELIKIDDISFYKHEKLIKSVYKTKAISFENAYIKYVNYQRYKRRINSRL